MYASVTEMALAVHSEQYRGQVKFDIDLQTFACTYDLCAEGATMINTRYLLIQQTVIRTQSIRVSFLERRGFLERCFYDGQRVRKRVSMNVFQLLASALVHACRKKGKN